MGSRSDGIVAKRTRSFSYNRMELHGLVSKELIGSACTLKKIEGITWCARLKKRREYDSDQYRAD